MVDRKLGSKLTMSYPAIWLLGERAPRRGALDRLRQPGQHQDAGGKAVHVAPDAPRRSPRIDSKNGGRASYRGLLEVAKGAEGAKSKVVCDALILDEDSRTAPIRTSASTRTNVDIGHEATVSRSARSSFFYLNVAAYPKLRQPR